MKLLKLTVLSSLLFSFLLTITSCEKEEEKQKSNVYTKGDIQVTAAQVFLPASTSTASGTMAVRYDKRTKVLAYTIIWSGLSGAPSGITLHGPAPAGYVALNLATGLPAAAIVPLAGTGLGTTGTLSGTLVIDNTVIKEQTLLNHLYYIRINTAASPFGEIRGQIKFQ